jgi:hypothetical protein
MDEIKKEEKTVKNWSEFLFSIKELIKDHSLSLEQVMYLLCLIHNIEYDISASEVNGLYNKGLLKPGGKVNQTLLFHLKKANQLVMDLNFNSKPIGNEFTLNLAYALEKSFVLDEFLTEDYRKEIADEYFKGDLSVSRYFIIFRSMFPYKDKKRNRKWNTKFNLSYDGMTLWDNSIRVVKKFYEVYRKRDIGIFLQATYTWANECIDYETEKVFMTKPYKFLNSYEGMYELVNNKIMEYQKKQKDSESNSDRLGDAML